MISVIVTAYNVEDYLHVCINSVLMQSYEDFEIICIDDNSTDSSARILDYFSKTDSRIKLIKNDLRKGVGFSRNRGLREAKGKYVLFLNGNDWLSLNALEILVNKSEELNLDALLFRNIEYNDDSQEFFIRDAHNIKFKRIFNENVFNHFYLDKKELFAMSLDVENGFYLKSFLEDNGITFPNKNLIHNSDSFFYEVMSSARRISSVDERLYNKRKTNESMPFDEEVFFEDIDVCNLILNVFLSNSQLYQYYKKEILNYVFDRLNKNYLSIGNEFKERFFREVQIIFLNLIRYYDLQEDISDNVDENILEAFKFNEIVESQVNLPKCSLIIPNYNTQNELPVLLESIVNQTMDFNDMEIIIVDDASTDGSLEIIEEYSQNYENIIPIYLSKNSGSPSKPRNIGIRNASSDYIIFQDSDDWFTEDACELLYDIITVSNVDLVTGMIKRNDTGEFKTNYSTWESILSYDGEFEIEEVKNILYSKDLLKFGYVSFNDNPKLLGDYALNSKIYKKSLLIKNNIQYLEELNGAEDSVFLFHTYTQADGIVFINRVIYNYDVNRVDSLTHNYSLRTILSRPEAYKLMYDYAIEINQKDFYIENILGVKLNFWFIRFILNAPNLNKDTLLQIFKSYKILFDECINYDVKISKNLKSVCIDVKNCDFDAAISKVINLRKQRLNS